jgi:hypothetical protein
MIMPSFGPRCIVLVPVQIVLIVVQALFADNCNISAAMR